MGRGLAAQRMDARQHALFRAALVHGYAYLIVMPSDDGVWCRPDSATNVWAHFDDPFDDWAEYAVRGSARTISSSTTTKAATRSSTAR